jgi:hypothetical protein
VIAPDFRIRARRRTAGFAAIALVFAGARSVHAQTDSARARLTDSTRAGAQGLGTVKVTGRADDLTGVATTASEGHVGAADIRARPLTREGELLETVPGMIVTQHSGDGKANQYFVRGFNLDHGTDFQTSLDGMPVNMPSHAHGQGYSDLNFVIPEMVNHIDYRLGVYHPEVGDFGSAGAAELHLFRRLDHPFVTTEAGQDGFARIAAGGSPPVGSGNLLLAGELKSYDGPWVVAERLRKLSALARYSCASGASSYSILAMGYRNRWSSSDQIPLRGVTDGDITRFGAVDPTDGGATERYSLSGSWRHIGASSVQSATLFAISSSLDLFSDFTYFLNDQGKGDQFEQQERRVVVGGSYADARSVHALGAEHTLSAGLQTRTDIVGPLGLFNTVDRKRLTAVRTDDVTEIGAGLWVSAESRWLQWLRTSVGLRGDSYVFDVTSDRPENSGRRSASIASPKASIVFAPARTVELYLSAGLGFHSNDARGTTITVDPTSGNSAHRVDPLVRSRGTEAGARVTVDGLRSTLTLWALNLDSELLFTGDGGTTEPSSKSERTGVTWANFYRPIPELALDADVSLARARFAGVAAGEDRVPGAIENVVAGGVTWSPAARGLFGAIRVRHFGSYPLIQDNSVRATATTMLNADAGFSFSEMRVQITVLNVLDERANDIQYYYLSRLRGEPADGMNDIHFHPVEPRQLRVSLGWGARRY